MAYIKMQRLNGLRRALINTNTNTRTVIEVAHEWGFWNAGHFSQDYKEMFGELPSKTLRSH